ncbi:MAG: cation diffusion facilitator family transporter [Gemella sp.]|nr:cation diffusion facilitator family transporter [Gemella sp.]
MKSKNNILIAFLLNLSFAILEFIGGIFTGSVAVLSDAIHDFGDAIAIGASYFLQKKSLKPADSTYTFGYARFSIIAALLTTSILLSSSIIVIYTALTRLFNPTQIDYNGMLILAVIGICVNLVASYFTHGGTSLNQRAVNLHMLEDVLGWIIVLIGSLVMKSTNISIIDPLMSIGLSVYIMTKAYKNLKNILDILLEKTPKGIDIEEITKIVKKIDDVNDIHHIHTWSLDEQQKFATMHLITNSPSSNLKKEIRDNLKKIGINHVTIEFEYVGEVCYEVSCNQNVSTDHICQHHH